MGQQCFKDKKQVNEKRPEFISGLFIFDNL